MQLGERGDMQQMCTVRQFLANHKEKPIGSESCDKQTELIQYSRHQCRGGEKRGKEIKRGTETRGEV